VSESERRLEPLPDDRFCFHCGPDVPCFTECCAKLNLQLTPYDILRLARCLGITTSEFLERHVTAHEAPGKLPQAQFLMNEDDQRCPFVTDQGCTVYEDRPTACRTYPLARASSRGKASGPTRVAHFLIHEDHCRGFESERPWTVSQWVDDQDLHLSNELNDLWMEIVTSQRELMDAQDLERKVLMFNLASYDLDGFRRFVLKSGLIGKIEIPASLVAKLETNDVILLRFAMAWLKLALFGEFTPALRRP
jgi:hypothetical protein